MLTNLKNFKYLFIVTFFFLSYEELISNEVNQLAVHGGYTFETFEGQKQRLFTLVFLITVKKI